ncbi:hypothetical protein MMPV_009505 [Pyropia vietnamensis]
MEALPRVATEELMRHYAPGLAAQEAIAEGFQQVRNGVSRPILELFQTMSFMEEDNQAGGPSPPVSDVWDSFVYHALFVSFLSKLAHHVPPDDQIAADEATPTLLGGATSQLLGTAYTMQAAIDVRSHVVSFGCPRIGNASFRDTLNDRIEHTRLYVHKDPCPAVRTWGYAPHGGLDARGVEGWKLGRRRQAQERSADQPRMSAAALALVYTRHRLTMYATALKDHRDVREGVAHAEQLGVAPPA